MKRLRGPDRRDGPLSRSQAGLTDPGADAARARVATLLEEMTRVELQVIVVSPPDETRLAAEDRARDAALLAGRDVLRREAVAAAREATVAMFARGGFSGTWAFTDMAISVATAADRAVGILRATSDELAGMTGLPAPGSLSAFATPAPSMMSGPIQRTFIAAFVVFCVGIGLAIGPGLGLVVLALGLAIGAAMTRRQRQLDPP